jgi:flagellar export protein FliJ
MPFRFPLEAVLHFRKGIEHQQELRLRAANQQVIRVRHAIEQLDGKVQQAHAASARELAAGTTAAEIGFALAAQALLSSQRQSLEQELARLEGLRNQQQRLYQQARRQRETFESLRSHQEREYKRHEARREQRTLDDLFLLRRHPVRPR